MTVILANALRSYFETLYDLNRNLIMCCGLDVIDNSGEYEKPLQEIIDAIPRLVPYVKNKSLGKYVITERDGLLEFSDELPFLKDGYEEILQKNYSFLYNIKQIRNKLEHKMHGVILSGSSSGSTNLFDVTYTISGEDVTLIASDFIIVTEQINVLFSRIQKIVGRFAKESGRINHPYYCRLLRYDFCNFNKIYKSDLLRNVGQALFPF